MKSLICFLMVLVWLPAGVLGEEKLVVPEGWEVLTVIELGYHPRGVYGNEDVRVRLHMGREAKGGRSEVEWRAYGNGGSAFQWSSEDEDKGVMKDGNVPEVFYRVCEAAKAGKLLEARVRDNREDAKVEWLVMKSEMAYDGRWQVRVGGGIFLPEEGERLRDMLREARAAREWYEKLLVAKSVPKMTEDCRPPREYQLADLWSTYDVVAGEIKYRTVCAYNRYNDKLSEGFHGGFYFVEEDPFVEPVELEDELYLELVMKAAEAVKRGEAFAAERDVTDRQVLWVEGDVEGKRVRLMLGSRDEGGKWPLGPLFRKKGEDEEVARRKREGSKLRVGSFDLKQVEEILAMREEGKRRMEWLRENVELFYSNKGTLLPLDAEYHVELGVPGNDGRTGPVKVELDVEMVNIVNRVSAERNPVRLLVDFEGKSWGKWSMQNDEVEQLLLATEAVMAQREYKGAVGRVAVAATDEYGVWMLRLKAGGEAMVFQPEEVASWVTVLREACAARRWYGLLEGRRDVPRVSAGVRPAVVKRGSVVMRMDKLEIGGLKLVLEMRGGLGVKPEDMRWQGVLEYDGDRGTVVLNTDLGNEVLGHVRKAWMAMKEGKGYSCEIKGVQGRNLVLEHKGVEGEMASFFRKDVLDEDSYSGGLDWWQFKRLGELLEREEAYVKRLKENEGLFFRREEE